MFSRVAIIGLGLIGGSLAAGMRRRSLADSIAAFDQDGTSLVTARAQGTIDIAASSIEEAVHGAELVIVAVPVLSVGSVLEHLPDNLLITDVGSVKAPIVAASREVFGGIPSRLVPGHPIAGSEQQGIAAANGDLFEGHKVILTPLAETDVEAVARVSALWRAMGAIVVEMTVEHHDSVLAQTSHLPHLLAYGLVDTLSSQGDSMEIFQYAAGGFRDFSRIAASDPVMWRDIFRANGPAVLDILDRFLAEMGELRQMIERDDEQALETLLQRAKKARDYFTSLQDERDTTGQ